MSAQHSMREWHPEHPLDLNRGMMTKKAMGRRVKLANGDVVDIGRGTVNADGSVHSAPVLDIEVHMYLDAPGDFFDSKGRKLPDVIAEAAGYDVARLKRQREVLDQRAKVMNELREVVAETPRRARETRGAYSLVEVGDGLFTVADDAGDYMAPNTEVVARQLFDALAGPPPVDMVLSFGKGDIHADEA